MSRVGKSSSRRGAPGKSRRQRVSEVSEARNSARPKGPHGGKGQTRTSTPGLAQTPQEPPQRPSASRWLLTRSELADFFGVVPLRVTKWAANGMPVADRGGRGRESRYDLRAVVDWRQQSELQRLTGGADGAAGGLDLALERAKLARAQTRRAELEIRRREGDLLDIADVAKAWSSIVAAIRAKLLSLPQGMAARCLETAAGGATAIERALTTEIYDALRELAAPAEMASL